MAKNEDEKGRRKFVMSCRWAKYNTVVISGRKSDLEAVEGAMTKGGWFNLLLHPEGRSGRPYITILYPDGAKRKHDDVPVVDNEVMPCGGGDDKIEEPEKLPW